jgi:hypothetical protein
LSGCDRPNYPSYAQRAQKFTAIGTHNDLLIVVLAVLIAVTLISIKPEATDEVHAYFLDRLVHF